MYKQKSAIKIGRFNNGIRQHGAHDRVQRIGHTAHVVVKINRLQLAAHAALCVICRGPAAQESNSLMCDHIVNHGVKQVEVPVHPNH
jgi:hypothetical protein